jgi:hypothetical protein
MHLILKHLSEHEFPNGYTAAAHILELSDEWNSFEIQLKMRKNGTVLQHGTVLQQTGIANNE